MFDLNNSYFPGNLEKIFIIELIFSNLFLTLF